MAQKKTAARRACEAAAKACDRAYDKLAALTVYIPDSAEDRHLRWLKELREYGEYLERCTWPDKVE
jgi:hypothetical protein